MIEPCAAPSSFYLVAEIVGILGLLTVAFLSGGGLVWWRMTGQPRSPHP